MLQRSAVGLRAGACSRDSGEAECTHSGAGCGRGHSTESRSGRVNGTNLVISALAWQALAQGATVRSDAVSDPARAQLVERSADRVAIRRSGTMYGDRVGWGSESEIRSRRASCSGVILREEIA